MKLTLKKSNEFISVGSDYAKENDNKLSYAIKKTIKRIQEASEDFNEKAEDLRIEYCSTDEKGNVVKVNGQYQFTKENLRKLNADFKKLFLEIDPYFATEIPEDLTDEQTEAFEGIVIEVKETK